MYCRNAHVNKYNESEGQSESQIVVQERVDGVKNRVRLLFAVMTNAPFAWKDYFLVCIVSKNTRQTIALKINRNTASPRCAFKRRPCRSCWAGLQKCSKEIQAGEKETKKTFFAFGLWEKEQNFAFVRIVIPQGAFNLQRPQWCQRMKLQSTENSYPCYPGGNYPPSHRQNNTINHPNFIWSFGCCLFMPPE